MTTLIFASLLMSPPGMQASRLHLTGPQASCLHPGPLAPRLLSPGPRPSSPPEDAAPGQLTAIERGGRPGILVPLKKTAVNADIAGLSARVVVVQTFTNPSKTPIEAVYTFPLPADAAVDRMRMNVAGRIIEGQIKRREEARQIYDAAKAAGQVASLLDQERPNIFTQHVANILPGAQIEVEISYVQTLRFESGMYEFKFPMVVGPRYMPASTPDPDKVSAPIIPKGMRTGTNVSLTVHLDAGAPLSTVQSILHQIDDRRDGPNRAVLTLKNKDEIPNRDFVLRYQLKGEGIIEQFFAHPEGPGHGTFCLVLNPPARVQPTQVRPREVVFVMDQSGSQSGFPLEKSKELTLALVETLRPNDTFNVISFSNGARSLWPAPRPNNATTLQEARNYVSQLVANGGTEFLPAIEMSLSQPPPEGRVRLVVFNTDGYVGNEAEILERIQKYRGHARMFTFGIGNAVNHFLIDAMNVEGKGGSETVTLTDNAAAATKRFIERTHSPILTDVQFSSSGARLTELSPNPYPDLFAGQPVVVLGRYSGGDQAKLSISGKLGASAWRRDIELDFIKSSVAGAGVSTLWARRRVEDITRKDWIANLHGKGEPTVAQRQITDLALRYGIMTQYTSFVAVENKVVNVGGRQRTVKVPIEMADGVSYEIGGKAEDRKSLGLMRGSQAGGGGFGGSGPAPASKVKAGRGPTGITRTLYDPSDNSFIVHGSEEAIKALNEQIAAGKVKAMVKVDPELLKRKDKRVDVQIWVTTVDDKVLAALKKAGLTVDESDKSLKIVFGTIDHAKLEQLAKIAEVIKIGPITG